MKGERDTDTNKVKDAHKLTDIASQATVDKNRSGSSGVCANHRGLEVFRVCEYMPVSSIESLVWVYQHFMCP